MSQRAETATRPPFFSIWAIGVPGARLGSLSPRMPRRRGPVRRPDFAIRGTRDARLGRPAAGDPAARIARCTGAGPTADPSDAGRRAVPRRRAPPTAAGPVPPRPRRRAASGSAAVRGPPRRGSGRGSALACRPASSRLGAVRAPRWWSRTESNRRPLECHASPAVSPQVRQDSAVVATCCPASTCARGPREGPGSRFAPISSGCAQNAQTRTRP